MDISISKSALKYDGTPIDYYMISKYLGFKQDGVFIEVGGYDGVFQSNTYVLEKHFNWKGFLVEPSKDQFELCKQNRNVPVYNYALVPFDYELPYIMGDFQEGRATPMSSINGTRTNSQCLVQVNVTTLQKLLDELNITKVDFFSLDVEGYEIFVLNGVDFSKVQFSLILIEYIPNKLDELIEFMTSKNYKFLENVSNYSKDTHPNWDGQHNDYLFCYNGE